MKKMLQKSLPLIFGIFGALIGYSKASAQMASDILGLDLPWSTTSLAGLIANLTALILLVAGIIAFVVLIIGGISYMTAAGDPEKAEKAKNYILYAIIGIVIVVLAYAIVIFMKDRIQ